MKITPAMRRALTASRTAMANVGAIQSAILKGVDFPVTPEIEHKIARVIADAKIKDATVDSARRKVEKLEL